MSYHRSGMGALPQLQMATTVGSRPAITAQPIARPPAPGSSMRTILFVGALGVGGFLLYRHFKKKAGSAPTSSPSTPSP